MADGADTIFSFLLLAGYLTLSSAPEETEFGTFATLKIPNMEIRRVYNTEVLGWMRTRATGGVIPDIEKAIYLGDGKRLDAFLFVAALLIGEGKAPATTVSVGGGAGKKRKSDILTRDEIIAQIVRIPIGM